VMTSDVTAASSIYYAPYQGGLVPIYDGARWNPTPFNQLSFALNSTAHAAGSLYDIGVFNASGTLSLCTGPAWTNSTTRSAAISQQNGLWVNSASLTCNLSGGTTTTTVAAGQWTYLGTFYATAAGQTGMAFRPTAASGGTNNILGLYNAYNRTSVAALVRDSTSSWTYGSTTVRTANNSTSNRATWVDGLGQSVVELRSSGAVWGSGGFGGAFGAACDTTNTAFTYGVGQDGGGYVSAGVVNSCAPAIGLHYGQELEVVSGAQTKSFAHGMTALLEMSIPPILPLAAFRRRKRRPSGAPP